VDFTADHHVLLSAVGDSAIWAVAVTGGDMWWLFQVLIMTLVVGSNGEYHWASKGGGFSVAFLAAFAASWLSVWLNDLLLWLRRERR
jgi:hypothetical protein